MAECASLCVRRVILIFCFRIMRCEKDALAAMHVDLDHFFFARVDSNRRARAKCGRHSTRLVRGSRRARARLRRRTQARRDACDRPVSGGRDGKR